MKALTLMSITFILGVMTGSYYKHKAKEQTNYNNPVEGRIEDRSIYQYSYVKK